VTCKATAASFACQKLPCVDLDDRLSYVDAHINFSFHNVQCGIVVEAAFPTGKGKREATNNSWKGLRSSVGGNGCTFFIMSQMLL
jgi:hypothetical protein